MTKISRSAFAATITLLAGCTLMTACAEEDKQPAEATQPAESTPLTEGKQSTAGAQLAGGELFVEAGPALKDDAEAKEKCPFLCEVGGESPISGDNAKFTGKWSPTTLGGKTQSICECEVEGKIFIIDGPALEDNNDANEKCPFVCEAGGSVSVGGKNCQWTGLWSPTTLGGKSGSICQCTTASETVAPTPVTK